MFFCLLGVLSTHLTSFHRRVNQNFWDGSFALLSSIAVRCGFAKQPFLAKISFLWVTVLNNKLLSLPKGKNPVLYEDQKQLSVVSFYLCSLLICVVAICFLTLLVNRISAVYQTFIPFVFENASLKVSEKFVSKES